jgi:hypothetical protein
MFQTHNMGFDDQGLSVVEPFPQDVEFVISALEAGSRPHLDERQVKRAKYRVRAMFKLYSEGLDASPILIYTRNVSSRGMGFLCSRQLPISHGGVVLILNFNGDMEKIACIVLRSREASANWFEGAVHFNRPQASFDADLLPESIE